MTSKQVSEYQLIACGVLCAVPIIDAGGASKMMPKLAIAPYSHTKVWFDALWTCGGDGGGGKEL